MIMKNIFTTLILFIPILLCSQVTFIIDSLPAYTPPEDLIYIAGNFNGWNPGDPAYVLSKNEEQKWSYISAAAPEGMQIEYKFTRGSWETVEKGPNGEEIGNRQFTFGNGDTVHVIIANWRQDAPPPSTAAENVEIMDEDFEMPQLGRTRRIWIYYPPDYETSGARYPVLYMHDGQNLFDDATSFAGEWHVDETLNDLHDQGLKVPIVIGIDNGGEYRLPEYMPWVHPIHGGGEGDLYMQFIVETLKPYIDANYNTMPGRDFTGIMGSSLGGLISHYGALKYQDIFSKAGIYSPSYWIADSVWAFTHESGHQHDMRLYFMCGGAEGQSTINNMIRMQDTLLSAGFPQDEISQLVIPGGEHNEALWSSDFGDAYQWLFASYTNDVRDPVSRKFIRLFPNPAGDILALPVDFPDQYDSLEVIDMEGHVVLELVPFVGKTLDISGLVPGLYLVSLFVDGVYYQGKVIRK
jgi:predicted alpha/beta superfamily hydrolase